MTHLRIELPTTGIEQVSSSVIEKLYNLAVSGDLDASSNLLGRLSVNATYLEYIDELEDLFDELYISATKIYLKFQDPEVERILLALNIGDGTGITATDAAALTGQFNGNNSPFMNNTTITSFDEFRYFGYTSLYSNLLDVGAFRGCTNLTSIDLRNITSVGKFSFSGCSNLESVGPFHGTTIENMAFLNCRKLSSINLSSVTSIGERSFDGCAALTEIDLSSVTSISGSSSTNGAFINCTGLTTVTNLNSTGLYMFYGCTGLTSVGLTLNCTSISSNAFNGCTSLTSIDLSNITNISGNAFENCHTLSNISLPSITTIGGYAFYNCTGISKVEIGPNLTTLGAYAFLTNLGVLGINPVFVFSGTTPPSSVGTNVFFGSWAHLYVPDGYESAYQTAFTDLRCTVYPVSQLPT